MSWQGPVNSEQLALDQTYSAVQVLGGGQDLVVNLSADEVANILLKLTPDTTLSEDGDVIIATSPDGSQYESSSQAQRIILRKNNPEGDAPDRNVVIAGIHSFKILARSRTYSDGAGSAGDAKLDVTINVA